MLCLGRDFFETVVIGQAGDVLTEPIVITMLPTSKANQDMRIGIDAQRDVRIVRGELLEDKLPTEAA